MSEESRPIDGNGYTPEPRRTCELCQKTRIGAENIAMFSRLLAPGGKSWDICGKCVQVLWRKRAPKLEPVEM